MPDNDEVEKAASAPNDEEEEDDNVDDEEVEGGDDEDDDEEVAVGGLTGPDIARVLQATGPVVIKCVLLKHIRSDGKDGKPHPASPRRSSNDSGAAATTHHHQRVVLVEDIEEVKIDVTPEKTQIQELLGGPFTFLGQYEEEGTVVIARKDLPDDLASLSVRQLRELCRDHYLDYTTMLEKSDLVDALYATQLPYNPHQLQPPLDKVRVRGDILLMRVAATDESLDDDDNDNKKKESTKIHVLPNNEFFLDYTKEEYVHFASRTDVRAPEPPEDDDDDDDEESEDGNDDDEDDEDDEEYDPTMEDEEEKLAMLNLVMGEVLRKFREEHGRGPDTRELLEIRSHVASQLDVEVATVEALEESAAAAAATAKKRKRSKGGDGTSGDGEEGDDNEDESKPSKHVKFQASLKCDDDSDADDDDEGEPRPKDDDDDAKPPAKEGKGVPVQSLTSP